MFVPLGAFVVGLLLLLLLAGVVAWRVYKVTRAARLFRAVAEGASDGLVLMRRDSKILWTNAAYSRIMGYEHGELVGQYPLLFALPERLALPKDEAMAFCFNEEEERFGTLTQVENVKKDGTEFMHEFSHAALQISGTSLFLLSGRDITERVAREKALLAAQERLKIQSRTDGLTRLANRSYLQSTLDVLCKAGEPFSLLHIDLNRMKQINDTFGHLAGDAVLIHIANAFRKHADPEWLCARIGGDEFVIVLKGIQTLSEAKEVGRQMAEEASRPLDWKAVELRAEISVGVVLWDETVQSTDDLLNRADVALYEAKSYHDVDVVVYDSALAQRYAASQSLERDVVDAMKCREFTFYFQPIFDISTRLVQKHEMLVRWKHPERGFVPPDRFLPVLEQAGLTNEFDAYVIGCAQKALRRLDAAGLKNVGLSINLSKDAFLTHAITDQLTWLVECGHIDPNRISLEILESTALSLAEDDLQNRLLRKLKDAGYRIFLDDFGMGYAGLAHLAGLPCSGIKIDRGLTSAVDTNSTSRAIVTALVRLANELGLDVVTEGVETMAQMEIVRAAGCSVFQGYAVARPMPLSRAISWTVFDDTVSPGKTG